MEQGRIEHHIGNLDARMTNLESSLSEMETRIAQMHEILTTAKGGWRVLVAIGAIVTGLAMIVSAGSTALHWITGR